MKNRIGYRFLSVLIIFVIILLSNIYDEFTIKTQCITDNEIPLNIKWSEKIKLSNTESPVAAESPEIAVDADGNIHVVWFESTNPTTIVYTKLDAKQKEWSTPLVISNATAGIAIYPKITIDANNIVYVLWRQTGPKLVYRRCIDKIWSEFIEVAHCNTSVISHDIVVDQLNNIHVVWSDKGNIFNYNLFYKIFNATALSWSQTWQLSENSTFASIAPDLVIDSNNNLHLTWIDANASCVTVETFYQYFDGKRWLPDEPYIVSTIDDSYSLNPNIAVDINNNVHFFWKEYIDSGGKVFYSSIIDNTISTTKNIGGNSSYYPSICSDNRGNTHMVWIDSEIIHYKRIDSRGKWSITEQLSDLDTAFNGNSKIVVDSRGNIHIVWHDYLTDHSWEIYYTKGSQPKYLTIFLPISIVVLGTIVIIVFILVIKKVERDFKKQ